MVNIKDYLLNIIPVGLLHRDSYVDSNGKGLFQRTIESFGDELDTGVLVKLGNLENQFDVDQVDDNLFDSFVNSIGYLPDFFNDKPTHKSLIKYIQLLYSNKGKLTVVEYLLNILGIDATITNDIQYSNKYDTGLLRDDSKLRDGSFPGIQSATIVLSINSVKTGSILEQLKTLSNYQPLANCLKYFLPFYYGIKIDFTGLPDYGSWWELGIWIDAEYWVDSGIWNG